MEFAKLNVNFVIDFLNMKLSIICNNCQLSNILLLRKDVFPYDCMDEWEKFNKTSLTEKEEFYSNLNMEVITNSDYLHTKRVCKDFEIKNLGEYHDLFLKSDTLFFG